MTLVLQPRFNSRRVLEMIAAERVTVFEGTPAMFRSMLAAADRCPQNLDSLRVCLSIGSPIPADALRRFEDKFAGTGGFRPPIPPSSTRAVPPALSAERKRDQRPVRSASL